MYKSFFSLILWITLSTPDLARAAQADGHLPTLSPRRDDVDPIRSWARLDCQAA